MAAIDETNDGDYLAFVVGGASEIYQNARLLPSNFKHMTSLNSPKNEKKAILKSFNFEGNILMYCVRFGIPTLRNTVDIALSVGRLRQSKKIVNNKIAYEFVDSVRFLYTNFAIQNGQTICDFIFEVDNPTIQRYLKDGGLRYRHPGDAHKIADCVAYANGHHWFIHKNIHEKGNEFKEQFQKKVMKTLTR